MSNAISITLAVEDRLSEIVLRTILHQSGRPYDVTSCIGLSGFGYLRKNIRRLNNAAGRMPILILTDLDKAACAPILQREWLDVPRRPNLLFRVAVRAVESWVMAHRTAFAAFLGIRTDLIPSDPDGLDDPKRTLLGLAAKSRKRDLREAIIPMPKSTAKEGPDYNDQVGAFIIGKWNVREAVRYSASLQRAFQAITTFHPI